MIPPNNSDASHYKPGKKRTTSNTVATKPGCAPLKAAYAESVSKVPKRWADVEECFLRGMESFDANIAAGTADMGDLQNGKGDFFNDTLALILENCAKVDLFSRGDVPGLIFPKHKLDVTYPNTGPIEFILEAKAVGTPKHPGSPKEDSVGRPGSADLDKRVKEIAFKTIDLKAEFGRRYGQEGGGDNISGDLTSWLRSVRPKSYVFIAARVINDKDRARVVRFADVAALVSDAVGVFCFGQHPTIEGRYVPRDVPSHLEMDRVLYRACVDLTAVHRRIGAAP